MTRTILGYRLAAMTLEQAASWSLEAMRDPRPKLLVTLNPEIIVSARDNPRLEAALQSADLTVADGIGVVWASRRLGQAVPERVPGVELCTNILETAASSLRVFFLGAKPGIAQQAAQEAQRRYGTVIAGVHHGYFKRPEEVPGVVKMVRESQAHLLLAGLGEGQELFLHENRTGLNVPLMIGVGGTLDVLSGTVKRTPAWTRHMGLEWAYRVGLDRKRWYRFPRLLKFARLVLEESSWRQQA
jgi:N-acetylglucosaminyldiphosphoundecaprenol N-acetyl-beta-D-mannosaminyltransferase